MARRIHQSLLRHPYFLDVPREVILVEIVLFLLLIAAFGPKPLPLGLGALFLVPAHLAAARMTREDSQGLRLLLDGLRWRSYYPAHARLSVRPGPGPCSAMPRF